MPPHPITAVDLLVRDLEKSVAFYTGQVGLPEGTVSADGHVAVLPAGPAVLRLRAAPDAADSRWVPDDLQMGFRHIGFTVSDIDERAAALRGQGVRFRMEPKDAHGGVRIAFFYDPDGVLLEFVQGQLRYDRVHDQGLVDAARAAPALATPSFDHVAVTVGDLDATVKTYADALGFGVAGQLIRDDDPRGFGISYLHAGRTVLEVFTYTAAKQDSPWSGQAPAVGFRDVVFAGEADEIARRLEQAGARRVPGAGGLLVDPNGFGVRVETAP